MIKIGKFGHVVSIHPWLPALAEELTCYRQVTKPNWKSSSGLDFSYSKEPLYSLDKRPDGSVQAVVYGGLFTRIVRNLKKLGVKFEVRDYQAPLPEPDFDRLSNLLRPNQNKILAAICSSNRGVIVAPPAMGKTYVIEQICRIYKGTKILITTPKKEVLKDIYERVSLSNPRKKVIQVHATSPFEEDADVAVCSSKSLHNIPPDWCQLLLFDEVHGAAAPKISKILSGFTGCRRFGFTASPQGRSDASELYIEALFGPVICEISYTEAEDLNTVVPIEVSVVNVDNIAEIQKKNPVSKERHNIWRNRTRNGLIAQVARNFKDDQVLILVKTVEHAMYLRKMLPEYTLVHAGMTQDRFDKFSAAGLTEIGDILKPDIARFKEEFREGTLKKAIATMCWREGIDFPELSVLIRADGQAGAIPAIQIGGRLSRISKSTKTKGLIVDFNDKFSSTFHNRCKKRLSHYRKQGWRITEGVPPESVSL